MATVKSILEELQSKYKQLAPSLEAQERQALRQAIEEVVARAKKLKALQKELVIATTSSTEQTPDTTTKETPQEEGLLCYTITIEDTFPAVRGESGIWTTKRIITRKKVDCNSELVDVHTFKRVHTLIETPTAASDPYSFALYDNKEKYTFQQVVDNFGMGSLTWKAVRDLKFSGGPGERELIIAWQGNSSQTEYTYIIRDSGVPTQQQDGFVVTRTIEKIDMSPGRAPANYIQIQGNVYAQDLSVDEIIRRRDTNNPNFNTVVPSGTNMDRDLMVSLFGQTSNTWQQFLQLERKAGAGSISFDLLWSFDPTANADGTDNDLNAKQLLAHRQQQITSISQGITPCDTADAKRMYLQFLLEFQRVYLELNPDNKMRIAYTPFYTSTVVPAIASTQTAISNSTEPIGQINSLEGDNDLAGKIFHITTGINAPANQIAGKLYYVRDTGNSNTPVKIQYFKENSGEPEEITTLLNTPNAQQVQEGFAAQLLARAAVLIRAGVLSAGGADADLFGGPSSMHTSGSTLRVKADIGIPVPLLFTLSDGNPQVTNLNQCNQPVAFNLVRTAQLVANPNCLPSGFSYTNIIAADQSTGVNIGNPVARIADNPNFNNTSLPATALSPASPTLAELNAFFRANPGATTFTQNIPLVVPPPPPPPANIIVNTGYWNVTIVNPTAALAALQPLIDFLCFFPARSVRILGFLDYTGNPTIPYGPPGGPPTAPGGTSFPAGVTPPAGVVAPIDYIRAKALLVQNFILTNAPGININQLVVPPAGSPFINANVVNNRALAQTINITLLP